MREMRRELTTGEVQAAALEVLSVLAQVCEAQGVRYFLSSGTLIGAVRHHGFIPWDDDIDVLVPRPDYDRLMDYFARHGGDHPHMRLFTPENCPDYPYMIARLSDDRYEIEMENEKPYGMGVFVDIYPMDGLGNTYEEALAFAKKGDRLASFCFQATRKRYAVEITKGVRRILKFPVFCLAKLIGKDFFQKRLARLARVKDYDSSEWVGCVVWMTHAEANTFKREWLEEAVYLDFEGRPMRVPKGYDAMLRYSYGDYMQLPPEEERIGHHFYRTYRKREGGEP